MIKKLPILIKPNLYELKFNELIIILKRKQTYIKNDYLDTYIIESIKYNNNEFLNSNIIYYLNEKLKQIIISISTILEDIKNLTNNMIKVLLDYIFFSYHDNTFYNDLDYYAEIIKQLESLFSNTILFRGVYKFKDD